MMGACAAAKERKRRMGIIRSKSIFAYSLRIPCTFTFLALYPQSDHQTIVPKF